MKKWINFLTENEKKEHLLPVLYHLIENREKKGEEEITFSVKKIEIEKLNTAHTTSQIFYKSISKI